MANFAWRGEQFAKKNRFQRRWYKLMLVLASIVVFCTTYALILPAITMEQQCQIPEHQHSDACYTKITRVQRRVLTCRWDEEKTILHHHDGYCYDENGTLQCTLPEVEEHIHNDDCYQQTLLTEGHTHSDSCDTLIQGELICQAHVHTEDCYSSETTLVCEEPVTEGHTHGDGCYDEEGNLTCTLEETPGHSHLDDCYKITTSLICGEDSDHVHTDTCYAWETERTCGQEECEPTYGDPELICKEEEIRYHVHDESCYGEEGALICEQPEVSAHQHDESCWQTVEEPADTDTLTCTQEEGETHTHTPRCYGTWELTCGMEEHSHTEECTPATPVYYCGMEPHTHLPECYDEAGDLTCQLEEHTHTEECLTEIGFATFEMTESTAPVTTGEPLKITTTGATLSYRTKDENGNWSGWTEVTDDTKDIPGNASFKLEVSFTADVKKLIAAGHTMTYSPLPEWFRNVKATDSIKSGGKDVGTMTVDGETVTLKFNENWEGLTDETMTGSFYVEAEADLTSITDPNNTQIVVGNTTIKVNFDGDLIAQYGEVTIDKVMVKLYENVKDANGNDYDYIEYKLTVTAGADGCPDVKVEDIVTFANDNKNNFVVDYDSIEPTDADVVKEESNKLTWTVGTMKANSTATLTYHLILPQGYLGAKPKDAFTNTATVFSKTYERDTDSRTFEPKGGFDMSKQAGNFVSDGQGGGSVTYTVWIKAYDTNTYTMENATIQDSLDGTVSGNSSNITDEKLQKYLSYDAQSFKLFNDGNKNQNGSNELTQVDTETKPEIAEDHNSFTYNVGNLTPGECKTLTYDVIISPGAFTQFNDEKISIKNRVAALTDPSRTDDDNHQVQWYNCTKELTNKKWARKLLGDKVESAMTIDMGETSFTVPADSYQYQVVVNEAGDWDVSSATMKDDLGSTHMAYVGYVRVDAYKITDRTAYTTDTAAVEALAGKTPAKTVWVDINGNTSFEFTPEGLGFEKGNNYAYLLTYYAQPKDLEGYSTVIVANQFNLTGVVGINGKVYTLGGINVSASVQLEGSNHFGATKRFWYYDANTEGQAHGTMYWVLALSGKTIPKDTMLLDSISDSPHEVGGVVQAFIGDSNLKFSEDQIITEPGGTLFENYTSEETTNGLQVTLSEAVQLEEGKSLYFVVSTYPTSVPQENGKSQVYKNALSTKDPGDNTEWVHQSEDQTYVVAGDNLYKSMAEVFQVKVSDSQSEPTIKCDAGNKDTVLQKDVLKASGDGVYVAWLVTINEDGSLSGRYRITENIPAGMEVTYIQQYSSPGYSNRPWFVDQGELAGYTKTTKQYSSLYDQNPITAYYYTKGQEVIWDVDGLVADPSNPGSKRVVFLVVCKVTDSQLFLSGETKTYTNQVTLSSTNGTQLGQGSADVSLKYSTLGKKGTYNKEVSGGRYPFEIQINELGTDLVPGGRTIKLIDEMCDVLILDPASIKVVNTVTKEAVEFTSAMEGHTLTLTLPDDQPLTITYETTINAAPGQKIAITNNANWEGYATPPGGSVSESDFSYSVGAEVDTSTNPELTISKVDQYNTGTKLKGAEFTLTEMVLENGEWEKKSDGLNISGTTDQDGTIVFGKEDEKKLQCNTPYQLVETKAPDGYVMEGNSKIFVFAREETVEGSTTTAYPAYITAYKDAGAYIHYTTQYTHTVTNHKGEIVVNKQFANVDDSPLEGVLSGTYRFGLYEKTGGTEKKVAEASVTYGNGITEGNARFTNVELDKTYVVYELNDDGNPIKDGGAVVSGIPFIVSYEGNGVTVTADNPTGTVTVTNRINYPELPNTGGAGSELYTAAGAAMIAGALWLMYNQRKRRREGS